jgi:hypothetical protein
MKTDRPTTKARISAHSDKTKDMPSNAIIAFCTFYDFDRVPADHFDYCYKDTSVLTKIYFKLKSDTSRGIKDFTITLYPGSVFIIPMSTNRLYTHEIRPSVLPTDYLPTRMGYVVRCSKTRAIFRDGQTYIDEGSELVKMRAITDDVKELRALYLEENKASTTVDYGNIHCSMNDGDYMRPIVSNRLDL